MLGVVLAAVLVLAPSASATKYVSEAIGDPGSTGGLFESPRGVAVHQGSGSLYVVDAANNRVQQFDGSGGFVRAWGADVDSGGGTGFEVCEIAASCKAGVAGVEGGMFTFTDGPCGTDFFSPPSNCRGGIAVDQSTGDVYVTDGFSFRVQQFTASGGFVRAWGQDVIVNSGTPANSNGTGFEVCDTTTVPANTAADCKAGVAGSAGGSIGAVTSATVFNYLSRDVGHPAVVPAGAPNTGNVLIADPGNRRVQEFTAEGEFVRALGADVQAPAGGVAFEVCTTIATCKGGATAGTSELGRFAQGSPKRVAADATGAIYTVEWGVTSGANYRVQKITPQPDPPGLGASLFAPDVTSEFNVDGVAPFEIVVDPPSGKVFVAKGTPSGAASCPSSVPYERRVLELSPSGQLLDTHLACAGFNYFRPMFGLAVDGGDRLLFSSNYSGVGPDGTTQRVYVADEDGITPGVASVDSVTAVTASSAQIEGTVNANSVDNDFAPTLWRIQVSRNGLDWSTVASGSLASAGTSDVAVSGSVDGLLANTGYRVRIVTIKPFANPEAYSPEASFITDAVKPDVAAVKADSITDSSARLTGQIDPHSTQTDYRFEWGIDGFDNVTPVPDGSVGSGFGSRFVSEQLSGLQPGTTYQFRLVATSHTEGAATSATKTFTTKLAAVGDLVRGYELVSPADKLGGTGVGQWYGGPGSMARSGVAAWDGERFAAMGDFGSVLRGDPAYSFANDWGFADRVSDSVGWRSHTPLTHPSDADATASFLAMLASSEDLSSFAWGMNSTALFFDGMEQGWKEFDAGFISDWGAPPDAPTRWERFGPAELSNFAGIPAVASRLWDVKISADGSAAVGLVRLNTGTPRLPSAHGVAGPGDPTDPAFGDLFSGRSIYLADMAGGLTDAIDVGERELVNVCTGDAGQDRTVLPAVDGAGDLEALECELPGPGRDARLVSDHGASLKTDDGTSGSMAGTVSEDGRRVFFLAPDPKATGVPSGTSGFCSGSGTGTLCPPQLFVRQQTDSGPVVRWISHAEPGLLGEQDASLTGSVRLEGSTPDGDKVFFRTNSPLTADDPNGTGAPVPGGVKTGSVSSSSWDLYMYDLPDAPGADVGDGELTRVSAGPGGDGDCNSPLPALDSSTGVDIGTVGALRAVSADGSRVYFTCTAPLPGVGASADATRLTTPGGTPSTTDQTNLYLYDANSAAGERWRFIVRLPRVLASGSMDSCASAGTVPGSPFGVTSSLVDLDFVASDQANCVSATSDGGFVTFMTSARLTVDDAPSPATGDIYGYDADSDELVRVTAGQGGVDGAKPCTTTTATPVCWGTGAPDGYQSVNTNGQVNTALGIATDPLVAGDNIAFFQSASRLVPEDTDDGYDVYQWRNGELSLISTGASGTDGALYKGNDRTGRNVYLVTRDKLSWQDHDAVADIYTARVGGGIVQPPAPPVCGVLAGVCQDGGTPATAVAPQTPTAAGGGNAAKGRRTLRISGLSAKARKRAARTGRLTLRVRTSGAGELSVVARGRISGRRKVLGKASKSVNRSGVAVIELRLSKPARRALGRGRRLNVSIQVRQAGARPRSMTVRLAGVKS